MGARPGVAAGAVNQGARERSRILVGWLGAPPPERGRSTARRSGGGRDPPPLPPPFKGGGENAARLELNATVSGGKALAPPPRAPTTPADVPGAVEPPLTDTLVPRLYDPPAQAR